MQNHLYCVALAALVLAGCSQTNAPDHSAARSLSDVPTPTVAGPLTGGARTGKAFGTSLVTLRDGYVEEEFQFSGRTRSEDGGSEADYSSRILVRRPVAVADFNGTVVLDWNNVTLQMDIESTWAAAADVLMGRGFIYVSVSAQKQGVDGSPLGLFFWDPVRYADLAHPGDEYALDIFSQAALATLDPIVLPEPIRAAVARVIATGSSQSAGYLSRYINDVQQTAQVLDGFMPQIAGSVTSTRHDLVPILWINSQDEAASIAEPPQDAGLLRYWEVAGPPHTTNAGEQYILAIAQYNHVNNGLASPYDPEVAGQYGEMDPQGSCSRNRYPTRYVWSAGIVRLHEWLAFGTPPPSYPAIERDAAGELLFDEHGNAMGGFRLPVVDVPIGAYYAGTLPPATTLTACAPGGLVPLAGTSQNFNPLKMQSLYPSHEDYLEQLKASAEATVASGRLLPEHAVDLMRRAQAADVTNPVPRIPPPLPIGGGYGL